MPRRKQKCIEDGCENVTHGTRCKLHSQVSKRKFNSKREMQRHHSLVKKYGITLEEFWIMWEIYKGRCGICGILMKVPENRQGQSLQVVAVDHDHNTGIVRGLLCNACNKGLGLFKDSIENLEKAKEYLNVRSKTSNNS
jgi:hypothetical protein